MSHAVHLDIDDGLATVTLDRPEALNALDLPMIEGLVDAVTRIEHDAAVRAVLLRGTGDHFMAGGDLKDFHGRLDAPEERRRRTFAALVGRFHEALVAMRRMPKPIVAAVQGGAAGGGFSLMLAADLAVAADDAFFTVAYVNIGTSPDGGSTFALPRMVGLRRAMELALLGERFDAGEALALGLVNRVVPRAELEAEATALARRLADGPARAIGHTKRLLVGSFSRDHESQLAFETECFADCAAGPEFPEGVAAFVEKRAPRFRQDG